MEYKDTLNLPKTDFAMRANLPQREPEFLRRWEEMDLYGRIQQWRQGAPTFVLHDGPPYANGEIHMGHVLNKVLKDIVVKYKSLKGFDAPFIPGWDCHGLPIEHKVDTNLGSKKLSMSTEEFRKACRDYAFENIDIQREGFKRLGVLGRWAEPYLTLNKGYEAAIVGEFLKFYHQGSVYRDLKPVHWCFKDRTALAEAEVEYADHTSPSVYVAFKGTGDLSRLGDTGGCTPEFVIWTTTPWTLPANLAIAVHPELEYSLVDTGDRLLVLATELVPAVAKACKLPKAVVLRTFSGQDLEGLQSRHPWIDRFSPLILGEHVTLEQGTGLVHTAPGHGQEDYEIGLKYGLEIYNPVDDYGRFKPDVELFAGKQVFEANPEVVQHLQNIGALLAQEKVKHSYPHCWRCRNPLIFRATHQWFISMKAGYLQQKAIEWVDKVRWIPYWGRERILGMLQSRPDWCISRQRLWGVPITVLKCESCETYVLDQEVSDGIVAKVTERGVDVWFQEEAGYFLPQGYACKCGGTSFAKVMDILDVWFESGVSHAAVLTREPPFKWPCDLYLEGSDQHRGWFQSTMLASIGVRGRPPFEAVLTHGFVVDEKGQKMSKSLGNYVTPTQVLKQYGADIMRLWVAAEDYRNDVRYGGEIMKGVADGYRKIRNTARYIIMNLCDFDPKAHKVAPGEMVELDRWVLARLQQVITRVDRAYEEYDFHIVYQSLLNFCSVELSSLFIDVARDRLYCLKPNDLARRSAQTVLYEAGHALAVMMAPILSFTAEDIWDHFKRPGDAESVFLQDFPAGNPAWEDEALLAKYARLLKMRNEVNRELEKLRAEGTIGHANEAKVTVFASGEDLSLLQAQGGKALAALFLTSQAVASDFGGAPSSAVKSETLTDFAMLVEEADGAKCERCWNYSTEVGTTPEHPSLCGKCVQALG